jgi:release factor glutamine methyltransferase
VTPLQTVREVARELGVAGVPSPRVDAEHLVGHVIGLTRSQLYASDDALTDEEAGRLQALVERRRAREPLAYVLGEWGFRRLILGVDRRALVPRPETEVVVERCLAYLAGIEAPRVLDVGVGSGAIALAIADEHPGASVVAVDRAEGALALASENLERTGLEARVTLVRGHLLDGVAGPFDLVVSNPPYVEGDEIESLAPEVRDWEPRGALVGPGATEAVAHGARSALKTGGWLVLEVADGKAREVAAALAELGYESISIGTDLAGRERVVSGTTQ